MDKYLINILATAELPPVLGVPGGTGVTEGGNLATFISGLIRWGLGLIGLIFFILILIAGFRYATAGGDSKQTEDALSAIRNAVIGLFIIALAWVIANTVLAFIFQPA